MKRLSKYYKSDLMNIQIVYGGKTYRFNLHEELKINEAIINSEIKSQPSSFAFISMLHKKLMEQFESLKQERKRTWATLYLRGKDKFIGGRPYSDEMAKAYAEKHPRYKTITDQCIAVRTNADALYTCVISFIQRKDILQTLSANNRKEN